MGSQHTTLCLVNFSGKRIASTDIAVDHDDNWDGSSRPDRNFLGGLDDGAARCERAEINTGTSNGCWFKIGLRFDDGSTLSFRADQWDARSKLSGDYTEALVKSPENAHLEVFRRTGEDRHTHTNAFYVRPSAAPDNTRWMDRLLANRPAVTLNQITMPGSHDAGMYEPVTEWARTQSLSIGGQLDAGARYFDLRVCKSGDLWTYHGPKYGGKLEDILEQVRLFISRGAREVVFLKFRSYAANDRQATVDLVKDKLKHHLYTATSTPNFATQPLASLTGTGGQVVAVFTPAYGDLIDPASGIFPYADYGDEDSGAAIPQADDRSFGVYDAYSHQSEFAVMQRDQQDKWRTHGGHGKKYLFLLSWTLTGSTDNVMDLDLLSATANAQLAKQLHAMRVATPRDLPNIVYLDQIDPYLCKAIVDLND